MSSEEKEPYFDGPLVTPGSGQMMFYPGQNVMAVPGENQLMQAAHNPALPPPGPAFYNPNDFNANPHPYAWNPLPPVADHQAHSRMNGSQETGDVQALPGAQAYFGGTDSSSSAASSQHTSPQHVHHQKMTGDLQSQRHLEPQLYTSQPHMMHDARGEYASDSPHQSPHVPNDHLYPGASPPTPAVPDHGGNNIMYQASAMASPPQQDSPQPPPANFQQEDNQLQDYMNSRPGELGQYGQQFQNEIEEVDHSELQDKPVTMTPEPQGQNSLNTVDLHNTSSAANTPDGSDQSYMNMAYNHNYSGAVAAPLIQSIGNYAGAGFQAEPTPLMVPSSSSQDYDILHSQGSWNAYSHNVVQNYNQSQTPPAEAVTISHGVEDLAEDINSMNMGEHPALPAADIGKTQNNELEQAEKHAMMNDASKDGERNEPASGPILGDEGTALPAVSASGGQRPMEYPEPFVSTSLHQEENPMSSLASTHESNPENSLEPPPEGAATSLTDQGSTEHSLGLDAEQRPTGKMVHTNPTQAPSYCFDLVSTEAQAVPVSGVRIATHIQDGIVMDATPLATPASGASGSQSYGNDEVIRQWNMGQSETLQLADSVVGKDEHSPAKSMDVVAGSSGLHPQASDRIPHASEPDQNPSLFASPTSAFESRIRSPSTSSNNSTTSSHKSAGSQSKNVQMRPSHPAAHPSMTSSETSEPSVQTHVHPTNPFSTNTMHSSHVEHPQQFYQPQTTNRTEVREDPPPSLAHSAPNETQDENLRTSAFVPANNNPQSLHSQVLPHGTIYTPEQPPPASVSLTYSERPQNREPVAPPVSATIQRHAAVNSESVAALKFQDRPEDADRANDASLPSLPATVSSDPYLSRSINSTNYAANNSVPPPVPSAQVQRSHEGEARRNIPDDRQQSPRYDSSEKAPSRDYPPTSDGRDRPPAQENRPQSRQPDDERYGQHDSPRHHRQQRDAPDHGPRNEFYDRGQNYDRREPRRQGYPARQDDPQSRRREWDYSDDPYRVGFDSQRSTTQGRDSRPHSRQEEESSHYSRQYSDRDYNRDPYYDQRGRSDRYYDSRYQGYGRRDPYYNGYDHRGYDQHYDPYQRYPDQWHDRSHQYYDNYYYDGYYPDQRQYGSRRPDDEDVASVYSERSHATRQDADQTQQARRLSYTEPSSYARDYGYGYEYDPRYYDGSLNDESTLSSTYDESWQRLPQVPARQTPVKFSTTHTIVRFGPGGQLVKVLSNRPADNQPSAVEIHSLEILLQEAAEAEDLRSYAGPLSKDQTHKNDVLQFCTARSVESMKDMSLLDRRSTSLIWDFLALLVRQNGSVHGTDIAELLTKDHTGDFGFLQSPLEAARLQLQQQRVSTPNSISDDHTGASTPVTSQADPSGLNMAATLMEKNCNRFRELLLHGRKKDALEWAMKSGLWGHALLLASKTDSRTHAQVMLRFANSLPINDPLQTVYQLMSGRQPAAATCVSEEGWGDWRPHLAMILSNPTSSASLDMRAVLTMGDTLSSRGLLHAAHFCYLMSSTPLGYYGRTTSKMVLLGGNHTLPFTEFAAWDSIRRTEIYEYAISLGNNQRSNSGSSGQTSLPPLQLYKFIYACKLAEYGLISQAFHYCERVAKSVCRSPAYYSATLVSQLLDISDRLRYHDPQIHVGIAEPGGLRWLETLRNVHIQIQKGMIVPRSHEPPSLLTASNAPSVISTASTSASPNDEIQFSAHTPDQDDEENMDDVDGGQQRLPGYETGQYGSGERDQHYQNYGGGQGYESAPPQMMIPDASQQQATTYGQVLNVSQAGGKQNYQQQFMQPQASFYQQTAAPAQDFGSLANQANPLSSAGYSAPPMHQQSYGYDYNQQNQQQAAADEEAERNDQVDFYDYMSSTRKQHHTHASSRSRTVSQSSQRSRASTLKGYDRTTPTSMVSNHSEQGQRSRKTSENSAGKRSRKTSGDHNHHQHKSKPAEETINTVKKSGSWSLLGWLTRRRSNQVHLPDDNDKQIVWDNDKKRWVNKGGTEEEAAPPPPPPTDGNVGMPAGGNMMPSQPGHFSQGGAVHPQSQPLEATPGNGQPPSLTANRFSLKNLGGNRTMYKNAFESSSKPVPVTAAPSLLPGMQISAPVNQMSGFLIPNAAAPEATMTSPDPAPAATSTPMHSAGNMQTIQPAAVAPAPQMPPTEMSSSSMPAVPTMFYNPSQFGTAANILSQPAMAAPVGDRGSVGRGRGRPNYPARR